MIACRSCWLRVTLRVAKISASPSGGRLDRVEPGLDAVDVLARERVRPLLDLRARARALDLADRVRLAEVELAVADRVRVPVERAHRRAGGPVALVVVLAAVARAAEAGGNRREQRHVPDLRLLVLLEGTVRLDGAAEVGAAVGDDREARLPVGDAVVPHERRPPRDLALVGTLHERRD